MPIEQIANRPTNVKDLVDPIPAPLVGAHLEIIGGPNIIPEDQLLKSIGENPSVREVANFRILFPQSTHSFTPNKELIIQNLNSNKQTEKIFELEYLAALNIAFPGLFNNLRIAPIELDEVNFELLKDIRNDDALREINGGSIDRNSFAFIQDLFSIGASAKIIGQPSNENFAQIWEEHKVPIEDFFSGELEGKQKPLIDILYFYSDLRIVLPEGFSYRSIRNWRKLLDSVQDDINFWLSVARPLNEKIPLIATHIAANIKTIFADRLIFNQPQLIDPSPLPKVREF